MKIKKFNKNIEENKLKDYSLSFAATSLLIKEIEIGSVLYLKYKNWEYVKEEIVKDNLFNKKETSTTIRIFSEVKKRLTDVSYEELRFILYCSTEDLKLYCLLLCIKTHRFIYEFILEIVVNAYFRRYGKPSIIINDYKHFFSEKSINSTKLQKITKNTKYKVQNIVFKILKQSGIIDLRRFELIVKPSFSEELELIIVKHDFTLLSLFLYSDDEIEELKKNTLDLDL